METEDITRFCERLSISEDDGPIMRVEMPLQEKGKKSVAMCLFGKLIANKEINREAFRSAMPRIWRTTKDLEIEAMGMNMFVFRFKCEWDRKRILEGGPWCFDKHLLVLREAHGIGKVSDIDFQFSPMWIQLHNIPLVCMSKDMGRSLGEMVGTVVDVDPGSSGDCLGKFLRVKVRVDVEKPLKRLLRVMVGDPEELCMVLIKYERMPNFCHFCGRIGHLVRECHLNVSNIVDDSKLRYGSWMRAAGPSVFRPKGGRSYRPAFDDSHQEKDSVGPNNSFRREEGIEVPVDLVSGFKCASQGSEGDAPCNNSGTEDVLSYIAAPSVVDENLVCDSAAISVTDSAGVFVEDGEISSPKVKRWKRLARGKMKGKLGSDHSPLLISEIYKPSSLCSELGGWNSRFHFEEAWTREEECAALINSSWKSVSGGNAVRCVKESSLAVASCLKAWNSSKKRERNADFKRLREESAPVISHLFFADDSLIFARASPKECRYLKDTLQLYEEVSGVWFYQRPCMAKAPGLEAQAFFSRRKRGADQSGSSGCPHI
ncbi:hypothetical protein ACOSQ3_032794 [Xanthoceras sorbifolium]